MRGETMDTPEFRQWLMGKLEAKTNPPDSSYGWVGFRMMTRGLRGLQRGLPRLSMILFLPVKLFKSI